VINGNAAFAEQFLRPRYESPTARTSAPPALITSGGDRNPANADNSGHRPKWADSTTPSHADCLANHPSPNNATKPSQRSCTDSVNRSTLDLLPDWSTGPPDGVPCSRSWPRSRSRCERTDIPLRSPRRKATLEMDSDLHPPFPYRSLLAVCAHPDDESFGLGAVISTFGALGVAVSLLCFTHGEASTLGSSTDDLVRRRADELTAAASVLGLGSVSLHSYPDGHLAEVPVEDLCGRLESFVEAGSFDCFLAFDEGGITGHPDHRQATTVARIVAHRHGLSVLAWTLTRTVADALNEEFGAGFVGRGPSEIAITLDVDRTVQHDAISRHASQSVDNPVLRRRLCLQGNSEVLVWLDRPDTGS